MIPVKPRVKAARQRKLRQQARDLLRLQMLSNVARLRAAPARPAR